MKFAKQYRDQDMSLPRIAAWRYEKDSPECRPVLLAKLLLLSRVERWAWDALGLIASRLLRDGERLPDELFDWLTGMLEREPDPPGTARRGRPATKMLRNAVIVHVVEVLKAEWKVGAKRNLASHEDSAFHSPCDAVAKAFGLPYGTVASVWDGRKKAREKYAEGFPGLGRRRAD